MFRLPVSQMEVAVRPPTGLEDLLLAETAGTNTELALVLVSRLVETAGDRLAAWDALPIPDLDALLLLIRRTVFGDRIQTDARCADASCGSRIDVDFSIEAYVAHHAPRIPRNVMLSDEGPDRLSWCRLRGSDIRFRLPLVADRMAVAGTNNPALALARRCMQPPNLPVSQQRRVEQAMAALAPSLSHELEGRCPDCGAPVVLYFDIQAFALAELRDQARYVYDDVHLIARAYQWSETEILALPRSRRITYAELIRQEYIQG